MNDRPITRREEDEYLRDVATKDLDQLGKELRKAEADVRLWTPATFPGAADELRLANERLAKRQRAYSVAMNAWKRLDAELRTPAKEGKS